MHFISGSSLLIGNRPTQQDATLVKANIFSPRTHLFAVMDGHGVDGAKISTAVQTELPVIMIRHKEALLNHATVLETLKTIFYELHEHMIQTESIDPYMVSIGLLMIYLII